MLLVEIISLSMLIGQEMARAGILPKELVALGLRAEERKIRDVRAGLIKETPAAIGMELVHALDGLKILQRSQCDGMHCEGCQLEALQDLFEDVLVRVEKSVPPPHRRSSPNINLN